MMLLSPVEVVLRSFIHLFARNGWRGNHSATAWIVASRYNQSRRLEGVRKRTGAEASTKRTEFQHYELDSSSKNDGWRERVVAPSPSHDSVVLQEGAGMISDEFLMGSARSAFWITNVDFIRVSWMRANLGALTANDDLNVCDEYHEASCSIP